MVLEKKKSTPRNTLPVVNNLNQEIEAFIREAVKTSFDTVRWDCRHEADKQTACWKIKGCRKKSCPSYQRPERPCWLKAGTFSGSRSRCRFTKQIATCHDCEVFTGLAGGPVRRLQENISILISLLQGEAHKLRQIAIRDSLTHLYNRNYFNQIIEREMARSERSREPLSFIMIDLDDFKQINDKLGHQGGDGILKEVAQLIRDTVRKSDLVFRIGGDEFLILMLNADCKKSTRMTARLLAATERWNQQHSSRYGCSITFSMGCATHGIGRDINAVLRQADEQMYRNKKTRKREQDCRYALSAAPHETAVSRRVWAPV